ncbi:CDP-diacylglycerol--serine O-phosphatidyltransferase [Rhodoplanes serenus]|uniref:CDP-diacylglycerol--serine O-phosphatidyltransferase n=1 Tax=Rhodoplanes serenus TaxID=200615 RepID=A0A9X4XIC6_9BRAD|nr:CDP-diacylglycerol--serine O-phosphatidyltransferase [Rhodoplanes serenus]MTW15743.1 CDP-diacylglycerol--serine O-phosphatidyltransferase [Rhodoplanes serenus]
MSLFPPFDPERDRRTPRLRGFRPIPIRTLIPNVITLLSLCAGLTAIRLAAEGRFEVALGAIVFAAVLDGLDGRLARLLRGTSRFGAELDSLADFVNFGVAPALILYFWGLHVFNNIGWIVVIVFAICGGLRLARFNVMIDDPNRPAWAANFFTGMPAPAGAIVVLFPIYLQFLGVAKSIIPMTLVLIYTLAIGLLMISKLPVWSGKRLGTRVAPEMVLPAFVLAVLFFALLISFPWEVLTVGTLVYLGVLPLGWKSYRRQAQADADRAAADRAAATRMAAPAASPGQPAAAGTPAAGAPGAGPTAAPPAGDGSAQGDRPNRLN